VFYISGQRLAALPGQQVGKTGGRLYGAIQLLELRGKQQGLQRHPF
jgi:hypothetical protein